MNKSIDIIINEIGNEKDIDKLYGLLIDLGKSETLMTSERNNLKKFIENFLSNENGQIRSAAIRVLGFYWGMKEYIKRSFEMFLNDKDEGTRGDALLTWANLHRNSNDKKIMDYLYSILIDETQPLLIRDQAYTGILIVSPLKPKDWPRIEVNWENFNENVNWKMLSLLLRSAQI